MHRGDDHSKCILRVAACTARRPSDVAQAMGATMRRVVRGALLVLAVCGAAPASQACVVGTGMGTCNEMALNACLPGGVSFDGSVTFNCGGGLVTIIITTTKIISTTTSIDGGGLVTLDAQNGMSPVRVFVVNSGVTLTLQNLTVANGRSEGFGAKGGGVLNAGTLVVSGCTFSANAAIDQAVNAATSSAGGAIYNDANATMTVTNSTFSSNALANNSNIGFTSSANGGAIFNGAGVVATITDSTFSGNFAIIGGAGITDSNGGAIYSLSATLTATNVTFVLNRVSALTKRGGALSGFTSTTTLTNCTFRNTDLATGTSIYTEGGSLTATNTIVSGTSSNCAADMTATITDGGHNLEDFDTCSFAGAGCTNTMGTSICNTNPQLDPGGLANNGGPTKTLALCTAVDTPTMGCAASPAINAGDQTVCANSSGTAPVDGQDQRGFARPGMGHANCAIGAFEADSIGPPPPATETATSTATGTTTETATSTATETATGTATETATATGTATETPTASSTATQTPTATSTATQTSTTTGTATQTATATGTATQTATATGTATQTPTASSTASQTATASSTATRTSTATGTATRTSTATATTTATATVTRTRTTTPTVTPGPPAVEGDVEPGDATVTGHASPNCMVIQVCKVGGGGVTPSSPPCTGPDAPPLGSGPSNASGFFSIPIDPPLQSGECIYAFDTCTSLTSPVRCAVLPAPAPALSPGALLAAALLLTAIAALALHRGRNPTP